MSLTIKFAVGIVLLLIIATVSDASPFPQKVTLTVKEYPTLEEAEEGCNCPSIGDIVCGSDKKIYENACNAKCKGVQVECTLSGGSVGGGCFCVSATFDIAAEYRKMFSN